MQRVGVAVGVLVDCSLTAAHNAPQRDTEGFYEQRKKESDRGVMDRLNEIADEICEVAQEERDAFDNLPEAIQYSERGEAMEATADELEDVSGEVSELASRLEELINS